MPWQHRRKKNPKCKCIERRRAPIYAQLFRIFECQSRIEDSSRNNVKLVWQKPSFRRLEEGEGKSQRLRRDAAKKIIKETEMKIQIQCQM